MDRNVGASFTLSVLTVLFFAVILYQPDAPPGPPKPAGASGPGEPAAAVAVVEAVPVEPISVEPLPLPAAPRPAPRAGPAEPSEPALAERGQPPLTPIVAPLASARPSIRNVSQRGVSPGSRRVDPPPRQTPAPTNPTALAKAQEMAPPPRAEPSEPRGSFTVARAGEALADVARRVYGDASESERLWRANRDLLDRADAPLRSGDLLRTP